MPGPKIGPPPSAGSGSGGSAPQAATVMALGDSITRNGYVAGTPGQYAGTGSGGGQSYLAWAGLLSKGRLRVPAVGVNATGGFKTADIIGTQDNTGAAGANGYGDNLTHLARVKAARPGYCVVLGGTNDFNAAQGDIATTIANLTQIYSELTSVGIRPVLCTLPPRNDISSWGEQRLNAWIARYARDHGYPLVDIFAALVDPNTPGQYLNGNPAPGVNNQDNVHPNAAGAKIIGQLVVDALTPEIAVGAPPLAQISVPGANDLLNLYQASADPTHARTSQYTNPDAVGNRPIGWVNDGGSVAQSEDVATAAPVGNYYTIVRAAAGDTTKTKSSRTLTAGNRYLWAVRLKASVKSVSGRWSCYLSGPTTDPLVPSGIWAGFIDIAEDVPTDSVFSCEFTCRVTGSYFTKLHAKTATGASVGVAQTMLADLTGAGIA
jgi:lysophospholipase L1-like esterase